SQKYKPADAGSKVHFTIKNFGINTGGDFSGLSGNINFVPANIITSSFNVSVSANTVDTDNGMRDKELNGKTYFDAEKYPEITITSTKVNRTNKSAASWYYFSGTLTMHGVTKPIEFPFTAIKKGDDYLFAGSFTINRLDFGVGKNSSVMSNSVKVSLSVLAKKS
ncbi:MAG: YceI family protein, partial [Chitinophagaceae bacterium]|nr:YceI family protein [Chitinophagaceae bacterium]